MNMQLDVAELQALASTKRNRKATDDLLAALRKHHSDKAPAVIEVKIEPPQPEPEITVEPASPAEPPAPVFCASCLASMEAAKSKRMPVNQIERINKAVCEYYKITKTDLISVRRTAKVMRPRHVAYYLNRTFTAKSLPEIGRRLGGKDHTSVLHGVRKVERELLVDPDLAFDVAHLELALGEVVHEATHS